MSDVQVANPLSRQRRWRTPRPRPVDPGSHPAGVDLGAAPLAPSRPVSPVGSLPRATAPDGARVSLDLLIRLTRLTPTQALVVGADLLGELVTLHHGGQALGGFAGGRVAIGTSGRARLTHPPSSPSRRATRAAVRADLVSAHALLVELARIATGRSGAATARSSGSAPGAADTAALRALTGVTSVIDLDRDLTIQAAALSAVADGIGAKARRELAGLVRAATGAQPRPGEPTPLPVIAERDAAAPVARPRIPSPRTAPAPDVPSPRAPDSTTTSPTAAPVNSPARTETHGPQARRPGVVWRLLARSGRWLAVIVVVLALLAGELLLLRGRIAADLAALRAAGQANPSTSTKTVAPAPVSRIPAAAGPIAEVSLRPLDQCVPGESCQLRVLVRLRPEPVPRTVTWVFRVTDLCAGSTRQLPGGSVLVPAGGGEIAAVDVVTVPIGKAFGVDAVTTVPARAASSPLPIPAEPTC